MDFTRNPEHDAIRAAVSELMRAFPDSYWFEHDQKHEFPWAFHNAMAAGGWLGTAIPPEYGGSGLGVTEAGIVLGEVAASGAGLNGASAIHISMFGINPVIKHGSDAMRNEWIPRVASGEVHVCFGVSEPDLGTDIARIRTRAVRKGDRYIVDGRKTWLTKASEAQKVLLLARTTPIEECRRPVDGLSLFFTDLQRARVTIEPILKMGRHAVQSNDVLIEAMEVPVEDRLGEEGRGFHYLLDGLNPERILVAMEAIGLGRAALRRGVQYAKDRVVYERPIGMNQGVQFPLADALTRLEAAELLTMRAAWLYDHGLPCGPEASMAKYLAADAGYLAADRALQTHGGFGYAAEMHVERYFREARLMRITPISENMILSYLAEHSLGLPKSY